MPAVASFGLWLNDDDDDGVSLVAATIMESIVKLVPTVCHYLKMIDIVVVAVVVVVSLPISRKMKSKVSFVVCHHHWPSYRLSCVNDFA